MKQILGIVVHGGAGTLSTSLAKEKGVRESVMKEATSAGYSVLKQGRPSVDAVESAISVLEDSGIFNAGAGSALTIDGRVRTDAAIMRGNLSCGAVGDSNIAKNPISLARAVMEKSDHVLIVGNENLKRFAEAVGYPLKTIVPSARKKKEYERYIFRMRTNRAREWPRNSKLLHAYSSPAEISDTVGAVAIDMKGEVAAGVSTGGRFLKLPGRIGDSAIVGAGLYADARAGAASATGLGEEIIKVSLCKSVCDFLSSGLDAQAACDAAIAQISKARGPATAGVIAVDLNGNFGYAYNTQVMAYGIMFKGMKAKISITPSHRSS
ncbi:MAG: isoaspartyl peptidase/L-asparaginase [Thaumarchaeota archaeon]|nr:isoaspartyl peptidase/L-asparaginase [Nitrososphaerota archaeon]